MATLTPVDFDPFEAGPKLTPVDHDPFAASEEKVSPAEFTAGMLRKFKQGTALGFGDEASAALKATFGGRGAEGGSWSDRYRNARDYERNAYDKATAKTGVFGSGAELLGSIVPSIGAGEIVGAAGAAKAASPFARAFLPASDGASSTLPAIRDAIPSAARTAANQLAEAMGTGSLVGAVQGVGDTEDKMDAPLAAVKGAVVGSLGGAAGYGAGKGLEKLARFTNTSPRVSDAPSTDAIKAKAQAAYDRFTNAGGSYTPAFLSDLKQSLGSSLIDNSWSAKVAPKVGAVIDEIDKIKMWGQMPGGGAPTPKMLQNVRGLIQSVRNSQDKEEARFGSILMHDFDNFISNPQPHHYAGADMEEAAKSLFEGNRLWSQYSMASAVDDALEKAERRAASTYSGGNENNAMRQEMRRVYERMLKRGGLSEDEKAAFETAIRGGKTENIARLMGKLAPSRGGLSTWANIGAGAGTGGATLPLSALAEGMKVLGDRATRRNLDEVSRVIRAGGKRRSVAPQPNAAENAASYLPWLLSGPGGAAAVRGLLD